MFAMSQQYAYAPAPAPRQYSGTSSAFSASANPDEDWTKISDLAERRRIQNRIAQRNYRKKLKRRLEDLERRAGTSDEASSTSSEKPAGSPSSKSTKKSPSAPKAARHQPPPQALAGPPKTMAAPGQFTPPMHHDDELLFPPTYDDRERSHTPPFLAYPAYPPPDEILMPPYGGAQPPYRPMTTEGYPDWVATTVPVTLPSMTHFSDAVKREGTFPGEESMSPYSMNYGYLPGIDMTGPSPYDSNPHTPPLSHSFDHSTNCSETGYEYPTTPLSMPGSPGMTHPQH